jgi:SAM-dependent methyltransferase
MSKIDYYADTFTYFKTLHPTIINGNVLDYGSNYGMFLDSSKGNFTQETYTGIDIDNEALLEGKKLFPNATFIHYNGFNHIYNPNGIKGCRPILENEHYDTIISYSVFTHTTIEDMLDTIKWLYLKLKPGGKLLLSWLDVDNSLTNQSFFNKRIKDLGYCDIIKTDDYAYLNDNKLSRTAESKKWLLLFFKKDYLSNILSDYKHVSVPPPQSAGCIQSCIIIERKKGR